MKIVTFVLSTETKGIKTQDDNSACHHPNAKVFYDQKGTVKKSQICTSFVIPRER